MHPFLNMANRAARAAGKIIVSSLERLDSIKTIKKKHQLFIADTLQRAESVIIDTVRSAYPSHAIETQKNEPSHEKEYTWIIDVIDDVANFTHDLSPFAVSIAVRRKDTVEQSLVYDPARQDMFTATRGEGAKLNNHRLRVNAVTDLSEALLGASLSLHRSTGFNEAYVGILNNFMKQSAGVRIIGSSALSFAYTAAGRLDGLWAAGLPYQKTAAGVLLIREAGGLIGDYQGNEDYLKEGNLVAAHPKLFKVMLQAVREVRT